jgi:hypothetical protein
MPRKVIKTIVEEIPEDILTEVEETIQEEIPVKPRKQLSEAQLANLERAREAQQSKRNS